MAEYDPAQHKVVELYDLMSELSDEHDADRASLKKIENGSAIVLEFDHAHPEP